MGEHGTVPDVKQAQPRRRQRMQAEPHHHTGVFMAVNDEPSTQAPEPAPPAHSVARQIWSRAVSKAKQVQPATREELEAIFDRLDDEGLECVKSRRIVQVVR